MNKIAFVTGITGQDGYCGVVYNLTSNMLLFWWY